MSPHFQDPQDRLGELRTALESAGTAAVVARAALYGMGGVGKTQLALKYSHAFRHAYAGVWWFRAEDPASVEIDALACCTECGVAVPEGSKPSAALKRWLAGQPSWLLVYDNAEDVEAVRGFLPDGGCHHLLITSRNPAWGGLARPVSLETWTPEQGADFLAARLPGAERSALLALAATLGGLPLALEQAASFMEETGMTVETYRVEAERIDTAGLILDEGRAATGYERSVLATLSIAFGRLSAEAAQLLRLCAFFSAEPIPERFFREQADSLAEPLAAAARDTLTWEKTVGQLRRFGLADRIAIPALDRPPDSTDARTEQALTLHRLTQEVTRHTLCAVPEDCLAVQSVLRLACPDDTRLPAHWPRYASLLPHVRHLERYRSAGWLDNRRQSWLLDRLGSYLSRCRECHCRTPLNVDMDLSTPPQCAEQGRIDTSAAWD